MRRLGKLARAPPFALTLPFHLLYTTNKNGEAKREVTDMLGNQGGSLMPRAYSYLRFSTPEQAKGDSRRRQLAFAEEMAAELKVPLDDSLCLQDLGVSAFRGKN